MKGGRGEVDSDGQGSLSLYAGMSSPPRLTKHGQRGCTTWPPLPFPTPSTPSPINPNVCDSGHAPSLPRLLRLPRSLSVIHLVLAARVRYFQRTIVDLQRPRTSIQYYCPFDDVMSIQTLGLPPSSSSVPHLRHHPLLQIPITFALQRHVARYPSLLSSTDDVDSDLSADIPNTLDARIHQFFIFFVLDQRMS